VTLPPASICLDAQGAQSHQHHDRGIARYIVEHIRALRAAHSRALHSVLLNATLPLTGNMNWMLGDPRLAWATSDRRVQRRPRDLPAIYHVMSPFELQHSADEVLPVWARKPDVATVVTLYDAIPTVFPDHYLRDPVIRTRYATRAELIRSADHVLTISQTTANDAVERLGVSSRRISVVEAGATAKFASMYRSDDAAWQTLATRLNAVRPGFVAYVAGFEFRKNLERVVAAYGLLPAHVRRAHQLVIACRMLPSETELVRTWASAAGVAEDELILTGYVTDAELGALYHTCTLFLFASIYEGSGLPILEAMACGAPVAASATATGPEILGDERATFDPYDPAAIASCLTATISSPQLLDALAERSRQRVGYYTWEAVADRTASAYERVLDETAAAVKHRRRRPRARIALVSPWPPEQSGIADYSLRLGRELGKRVDVEVVVAQGEDCYAPPQERGIRLTPAGPFRVTEGLRQPDRVLYCMGNSSFHGHVYELLRERPGAVIAHDVRLTGFYGWFAGRERPEDPAGRLAERIGALYGPKLPAVDQEPPGWERQAALGIYMTREIQSYAEQLFVHSRYARDVLELDRGVLDRAAPITVMPFGMPAAAAPKTVASIDQAPKIVSVGVVSEVKGLATLISAVALLAERWPAVRLTIAGPAEEAELQRWRAVADEMAHGVDIQVPGHLDAERYAQLLRDADVAVQLRMLSNGEASAAVGDCLAAGLPTIVSELGWAAELPDGGVSKLAPESGAEELARRLQSILEDPDTRRALSDGARSHANVNTFAQVAEAYLRELELV
jgi:glycosyltransferase involved in cell wall biosynthesis